MGLADRPWRSDDARTFAKEEQRRLEWLGLGEGPVDADALDAELHHLVHAQERHLDDCLVLYAGTNEPNPRLTRLIGSPLGSRPNLGPPGDTWNRGMAQASRLSVLADEVLGRLFGCRFVETRLPSGSIANLATFLALTGPGDRLVAFDDAAAGHVTHHAEGAAGLAGLTCLAMPFDAERMDVDLDRLADLADQHRPSVMIVAGSLCLFPYDVAGVRRVADAIGARVVYDAAHVGGLIAGRAFQQPLAEGAHVITGSTYKGFGGPPSGMILTDDAEIAERLDAIAYPGLTANFDLARQAALALAALDLHEHGVAYATQCVANARALADAATRFGIAVFRPAGRGGEATSSHHIALDARSYGGGDHLAKRLESANILSSSIGLPLPLVAGDTNGLRLGTQELTRRGMGPGDMVEVARLLARLVVDGEPSEKVGADATVLRHSFSTLRYLRR
jgi:glycine hydroxymethyltransferase